MEQEVRGSIPGLVSTISEIGNLLGPSHVIAEISLHDVNPKKNNKPSGKGVASLKKTKMTLFW